MKTEDVLNPNTWCIGFAVVILIIFFIKSRLNEKK